MRNPKNVKEVVIDVSNNECRVTLNSGTVITLEGKCMNPVFPQVGEHEGVIDGPGRGLVQKRISPSRYDAPRLFFAMRHAARQAAQETDPAGGVPLAGEMYFGITRPWSRFCRYLRRCGVGEYDKAHRVVLVRVKRLLIGIPGCYTMTAGQVEAAARSATLVLHNAGVSSRFLGVM